MKEQQDSIAQFPAINREDVQRFLAVLDERTTRFTFMVFDDNENRKDKRLTRILHGTLDEVFATLVDYSRRGCGVFVTINTTDFRGRTKECIVEVRAYFADLDGAPIENIRRLDLAPHVITETSPGRYGVYYMIADAPLSDEHFKKTQQTLASLFDGDPSVCDLPRVMRLPGFPHQKDPKHPFVTKIDFDTSQKALQGETPIHDEVTFQEKLAKAVTAYAPRRSVHTALASGIGKPKIDLSQGYAEGQRNNECARRAGYCFAQGMTEEEAIQECLKWNESNTPPLDAGEVEATVASIARREARKQDLRGLTEAQVPLSIRFTFDGDAPADPPRMLIKKLLPASGIAFIGGQSGAGKTFIAVALGVALAAGAEFCGYSVRERIGVAYVVGEGAGMFATRVAAAKLALGVKETLPFASADQAPDLQSPGGIAAFIKELELVAQEMWTRYEVRLGAIFMDTVAACFQMKDENDNAEASRVCRIMRQIADSVGAVIIPVHHYGKDPNTGLRGASAWRAAADVVLSVTCDVDVLSGRATNHCLAISKARDAEQGAIAPFVLEHVRLGVDEDGETLNSCVVRYNPLGPVRRLHVKVSKGIRALDNACRIALGNHARDVQLRKGDAAIRAVELADVKREFLSLYVTGRTEPKKAAVASQRAWLRALDKLPEHYAISRDENGREWIWLKAPKSELPYRG